MTNTTREPTPLPRKTSTAHHGETNSYAHGGTNINATVDRPELGDSPSDKKAAPSARLKTSPLPDTKAHATARKKVARGLTSQISTTQLKNGIALRVLLMANRFRVIRTIDVAASCFPERPYKAALTASQRAMRGLIKAGMLKRYRTDRFQTIYGINQKGADWLDEAGHDAASSIRRVSDMTNPEHRLWAQFLVICSEARGLRAVTEQELLLSLNRNKPADKPLVQGLLDVSWTRGKKTVFQHLRPDAVAYEKDGLTWFEVDRSKRGPDRDAALAALALSVGKILKDGSELRRVVVLCKTERIFKRALAVTHGLAAANNSALLVNSRRHFRQIDPGTFEVWTAGEHRLSDGRQKLVDTLVGHVIIELLPIWLPKVRLDKTNTHSLAGWFSENFLPYKRPGSLGDWVTPVSPLLISKNFSL